MSQITIDRAVLEQALEALSNTGTQRGMEPQQFHAEGKSIEALRSALEQTQVEQEPAAWGLFAKVEEGTFELQYPVRFTEEDAKADRAMYDRTTMIDIRPLYTHPQPPRQPLTDVQVHAIWDSKYRGWFSRDQMEHITRAVEAAHGIKDQK